MNNTKERTVALHTAARALIATKQIDVYATYTPSFWRELAKEFATMQDCHYDTARRHIAKACRRIRGDATGKHGGLRPGAGRPHKSDETEPAAGIVPAALQRNNDK